MTKLVAASLVLALSLAHFAFEVAGVGDPPRIETHGGPR